MTYAIMGKLPGAELEEIDTADTRDEAEYLLGEYRMAFGPDWILSVRAVKA